MFGVLVSWVICIAMTMYSQKAIQNLLRQVSNGKITADEAYQRLRRLPYEMMGCVRFDNHRVIRKTLPEAVYAPGKSLRQLVSIVAAAKKSHHPLIITRLEKTMFVRLRKRYSFLKYSEEGRLAYAARMIKNKNTRSVEREKVAVITAGTSDIPVAEEAAITLELGGIAVARYFDCGVAGIHRLIDVSAALEQSRVIICVAGMEGALVSVVAGMVNRPVIAVPTSVGYGASFKGVAPLLTMLNSCAPGVGVVNIDNGYGAACLALIIIAGDVEYEK